MPWPSVHPFIGLRMKDLGVSVTHSNMTPQWSVFYTFLVYSENSNLNKTGSDPVTLYLLSVTYIGCWITQSTRVTRWCDIVSECFIFLPLPIQTRLAAGTHNMESFIDRECVLVYFPFHFVYTYSPVFGQLSVPPICGPFLKQIFHYLTDLGTRLRSISAIRKKVYIRRLFSYPA